nr:hypothetical protein [Tanacetum cinerariifolium]
ILFDRRDNIPETEMPPRKRLCLSTLGSRYEVGENSTSRPTGGRGIDYGFVSTLDAKARRQGIEEVGYGIRDTWIDPTETVPKIAPMTVGEVNTRVTELVELHEHDTQDLYALLEDAQDNASLTWWNSQIRSLGPDAYSMTWEVLKKKMTEKYYPQGEIKKLEIELWNLKYVNGLPDNIYRSVKALKPKTLDETIELANDLMDQKLRTYAERQSNNKRKADESFRNNHGHQQQTPKRKNVARVYNMGTGERKPYSGNLPKYTKCHFYHNGPCTQKCHKCNKVGNFTRDCRIFGNTNVVNAQRNNGANPKGNGCFECEATGHFKRDCPKLKNKDGEKVNAPGWVYAVRNTKKRGNASRDPDSNVVTGSAQKEDDEQVWSSGRNQEVFVADETEKIDKYISGLPDNIYGSMKASKPKTLDETIELANDLMD